MDLRKDFEIILITYNRKENLKRTFEQIFAENSPIKNLQITILDNKSTDGSSELIQEYVKNFPNIKHIIHNRNIGGNANICRAFETAQKKYVWILCDDDDYDWSCWDEAVRAMDQDYDAVVVANYVDPKKNIAHLVKQLTFVPAGIYKTENITDTVMVNAQFSLSNMFAQLSIACHLINEHKRFYICEKGLVTMVPHGAEESYTRGLGNGYVHPYMKQILWHSGFVNSVQMLKDNKIKKFVIDNVSLNSNWFFHYYYFMDLNRVHSKNSLKNICDIFCGMNLRQKIAFLLIFMFYQFTANIFYCRLDTDKIIFRFLGRLKTHIRFKPKENPIV